jgi:hypothetical protein
MLLLHWRGQRAAATFKSSALYSCAICNIFRADATLASTHQIANGQHCPCAATLRASLYYDADLCHAFLCFAQLRFSPQHEAVGLTNVRVCGIVRATATTFVQSTTFSHIFRACTK